MTLFEKFKTIFSESEIATHYSDLYVPVTQESTEILTNHYKNSGINFQATKFKDNVTGDYMYDIPFGYMDEYIASRR